MDNDVSPVIDIYRVESGELQCSLKCHNAPITYIDFLSGDAVFVSSSTDGVFYGHQVGSGRRVFETILRGLQLNYSFIAMGGQLESGELQEEID